MGDKAPDTIPIANTTKHVARGNGWCFYQAVLESAEGAPGKSDDDSLTLATVLVGVLGDAANQTLTLGGRSLGAMLNDLSNGNIDDYLSKLRTSRNGNVNEGPEEWADGALMSAAYTIHTKRVVNIYATGDPYTLRTSSSQLLMADGTPYVANGGGPINLLYTETKDAADHKAGHFDWFTIQPPTAPPTALTTAPSIATNMTSRVRGAAKAAIADAKLRLKTGSANEIIIAGERVRLNGDANYVRHSDVAPITFYIENPGANTIKVMQKIFTGMPEFDEENPLPPCNGDEAGILRSALERRRDILFEEIEEKRRSSKGIKMDALVRHHQKLEAMLDALDTASGCNPYGEVPPDAITVQQQQRLEALTRQFAFLVLQGIDPIDISGDATLLAKSGNAKALVEMLEINTVTETELTRYLNMRKTIPIIIMNILDKSGTGRAAFQAVIDAMVIEQQNQLVLRIVQIIKESDIGHIYTGAEIERNVNGQPHPADKIAMIVEWLVQSYVDSNGRAEEAEGRVEGLRTRVGELERENRGLREEQDRLIAARDAALRAQAAAEAATVRVESERDEARRDILAKNVQITDMAARLEQAADEIERLKAELAEQRAKVAAADALQATLDGVRRELAEAISERDRLAAEVAALRSRAEAAEAALAAASGRVTAAEAALTAYRETAPVNTGADRIAALEAELAAAQAAKAAAEAAAARCAEALRAAEDRAAAAEQSGRDANARATTAGQELARVKAEFAAAKRKFEDAQKALRDAAADLEEMRAYIAKLQAQIAALTADKNNTAADAANKSGTVALAAAAIADARAALAAKQAELDALRARCAEQGQRMGDLEAAAAKARRDLEAERRKSADLLAYLASLSTAIQNGTDLPDYGAAYDRTAIADLHQKIAGLKGKADPSKYLCLVAYYVKFFMTLLFNQPGGKLAYDSILIYLEKTVFGKSIRMVETPECEGYLTGLQAAMDGGREINTPLTDRNLLQILRNVFGEDGYVYKCIALYVVTSQLYLAKLGTIPHCRIAPIITDPKNNMPRGGGTAAATAPASAGQVAARYPSYVPAPAPAPAKEPPDEYKAPHKIAYAADAITEPQAAGALAALRAHQKRTKQEAVRGVILKPDRSNMNTLDQYCSYGSAKHPLTRYPKPNEEGICAPYYKEILNTPRIK